MIPVMIRDTWDDSSDFLNDLVISVMTFSDDGWLNDTF